MEGMPPLVPVPWQMPVPPSPWHKKVLIQPPRWDSGYFLLWGQRAAARDLMSWHCTATIPPNTGGCQAPGLRSWCENGCCLSWQSTVWEKLIWGKEK